MMQSFFLPLCHTPFVSFLGEVQGDIQHRQHGEDERLHQSAEYVKVNAQHRGKADTQQRHVRENPRQPAQQ